ncbi:MAG: RNA polymerase sigma factor [Bryobacteraceae bacterium]
MSLKQHTSKPDAECFRDLHITYRDRILSTITGLVQDSSTAEEITAAAFTKAWTNREKFRGESSLYTWVHAIAVNEARKSWLWRRQPVWDSNHEPDGPDLAGAGLVTDALEQQERLEHLRKALGRIPSKFRRVLLQHFVYGNSVKQIAARYGIPCGTVLSRIITGKRLLRRAWTEVT